ncbi:uncharacterized protein FIBRA_02060 [Fibroporia radiculosa]|uniref:[histone H3]-trimethyl-L-lysine(9) demethylase n=1 Tax=Fibroporia radiculosa TaxID=599839 RepID=J4H1M5_9APHY|nr:uncharacterized protein FIBRA_02060 [Fibroporia radiculosa]CCM00034.1 predicted protein [Fibroporia radiculosa]
MSSGSDRSPSLTPSPTSRSSSPEYPVQPDHFYGSENANPLPPSPDSGGRTWLDPAQDPLAQRGIPVFKPTMEEFRDFEAYLNRIECWGMRSGIVKVIPPKEWTDALPPLTDQLAQVKLKSPIEQHMFGRGGLFRQENVERRRNLSIREWAELCAKDELRAPGVDDIGLHARATNGSVKPRTRRARKKRESETAEPEPGTSSIKEEEEEGVGNLIGDGGSTSLISSPPNTSGTSAIPLATVGDAEGYLNAASPAGGEENADNGIAPPQQPFESDDKNEEAEDEKPRVKGRRIPQTRQTKEANLAERAVKDKTFLETFDPHSDWLPPNTTSFDYTPAFCRELERRYWRNCGLGKSAWYGADLAGSLFTEETTSWNVARLQSALSRLLPASSKGLPGVNTPYLYFGMWRATFAWHVEDMDLFSINYVHFGAPKFWYAMPQARAAALEQTMRGYFPKDVSNCAQFLRHKSFLASPTLLSGSSCRPNTLVQHAGEFVITFPMGYHAGFNLGFNCAESVNFALDSWIDIGRKAKACGCVNFSVRIDVDQLLRDREAERAQIENSQSRRPRPDSKASKSGKPSSSRKRKAIGDDSPIRPKKKRPSGSTLDESGPSTSSPKQSKSSPPKVILKLGPKPKEPEAFPCCLCVCMSQETLLRVHDPPAWRLQNDSPGASLKRTVWMAHENCANVIPETWVDEIETAGDEADGARVKERVVFGVDAIVKDRWNLKCTACTKPRHKAHGAPIQCTKGRCPKAFHVSCARDGSDNNIVYKVLREVEKEVVLLDPHATTPAGQLLEEKLPAVVGDSITDSSTTNPMEVETPRVLKLIRKIEVQVLCSQHNPAVADAKRAVKQDKIRNDLLSLPPMSRIKLRVSAGVFEVSLVRVIEESCAVEVLWDRGLKREFKWGSVVFGNTEGLAVGQKPTEPAAEPERLAPPLAPPKTAFCSPTPAANSRTPVGTVLNTTATTAPSASASTSSVAQRPYTPSQYSQTPTYQYSAANWRYHYNQANPQFNASGYSAHNYPYGNQSVYPNATPYSAYGYSYQSQAQNSRELQWQQPYVGPKAGAPADTAGTSNALATQTVPYYGAYPHGPAQTIPGGAGQPWPSPYYKPQRTVLNTPSVPASSNSSAPPASSTPLPQTVDSS